MRHPFAFAVPFLFVACTGDASPIMMNVAIREYIRTPEKLTELCGRPIAQLEAGYLISTPANLEVTDLVAKHSMFGKAKGDGTATLVFKAKEGAPCKAKLAFHFEDEGQVKLATKRSTVSSIDFTLSNVVMTKSP
jgi:hypothetical protein